MFISFNFIIFLNVMGNDFTKTNSNILWAINMNPVGCPAYAVRQEVGIHVAPEVDLRECTLLFA